MKKYLLIIFSLALVCPGFAQQSSYDLSFAASKDGNSLKIEYFIQKTAGLDFEIGASDFPLKKSLDSDIDWSNIAYDANFIGPFSNSSSPNSYISPRVSATKYVNYAQLTKFNGTGAGFTVTSNLTKIGSLIIPFSGNCPEVNLEWERHWGALNAFATNGDVVSIKSGVNFIDPQNNHFILYDVPNVPNIQYSGNSQICDGSSASLTTSASTFDIQWKRDGIEIPGATDSIFLATLSGDYNVQLRNCNVSEESPSIEIEILPLPAKPIITENSGLLYSSVTKNIQWYHNGLALANATDSVLSPSNSGIYTVKSFNSCGEIFSNPYNYAPLGVDFAQNGASLRVFPNPYIGKTNIEVTLSNETELTIEVYDLKGNLVSLVEEGLFSGGKHQLKFSAQELGYAAGSYVLKVRTNEKELIHNLIELK